MRSTSAFAVLPLTLGLLTAQEPAPEHKLELKVLYAGVPDHARTAEWREFLGAAVEKVGIADVAKLDEEDAEDFDVVIVDAPPPFDASGAFKPGKIAKLPADWSRPTVALGYAAGMVFRERNIKLDWL